MCLKTEWEKPKIAIFPKIRYKVVRQCTSSIFVTPYWGYRVFPKPFKSFKANRLDFPDNKIVRRGIHTFKKKEFAKEDIRDFENSMSRYLQIYKVIIPPLTKYYNGKFGYPIHNYEYDNSSCSEKIIFLRKVK